jgi:hypothetical protein
MLYGPGACLLINMGWSRCFILERLVEKIPFVATFESIVRHIGKYAIGYVHLCSIILEKHPLFLSMERMEAHSHISPGS